VSAVVGWGPVPASLRPGSEVDRAPILDAATMESIRPVLIGFAVRAVRRRDVAEDLVQDTYLAAWQGVRGFEGRSTLRTWMVGILSRKIVDHYRRHRREILTEHPPEPTSMPAVEGHLDAVRARAVIQARLGTLPDLERQAVVLCDIQQGERARAAEAMGVTRGHLRVLLHRGRHRLRLALEGAGADFPYQAPPAGV
jgi:RNA polymerase sigma-70 factor, ECF subfamily